MTPIAVTGSTGRLGRRISDRLANAGVSQRLLVRDVARAPQWADSAAVAAHYKDTAAVAAELAGIETVLMVSGSEAPDRLAHHLSFVDGAVQARIAHLVYTSFVGAGPDSTFTLARDHWATEEYIKASGLSYTFLRDNIYADFMPMMIGEDNVIRGPAGDGRAAIVAQDDIADVAAAVLVDPARHSGRTYDLTGPTALTLAEIAAILSAATGQDISYHPETLEEAYASRARYGAPGWQVDAWVSSYTAIAAGELSAVSVDVEAVTGHPATALQDLLRRDPALGSV